MIQAVLGQPHRPKEPLNPHVSFLPTRCGWVGISGTVVTQSHINSCSGPISVLSLPTATEGERINSPWVMEQLIELGTGSGLTIYLVTGMDKGVG